MNGGNGFSASMVGDAKNLLISTKLDSSTGRLSLGLVVLKGHKAEFEKCLIGRS